MSPDSFVLESCNLLLRGGREGGFTENRCGRSPGRRSLYPPGTSCSCGVCCIGVGGVRGPSGALGLVGLVNGRLIGLVGLWFTGGLVRVASGCSADC